MAISLTQPGVGSTGWGAAVNQNFADIETQLKKRRVLGITIDGGEEGIGTGVYGDLYVPWGCTIKAATLMADVDGSIQIDVWKDTAASYPPTDADSITDNTPPSLSSADYSRDEALTDWTTALSAGD
jgi:hypothetical protein